MANTAQSSSVKGSAVQSSSVQVNLVQFSFDHRAFATTPYQQRCDTANMSTVAFFPPFRLLSVGKTLFILRK